MKVPFLESSSSAYNFVVRTPKGNSPSFEIHIIESVYGLEGYTANSAGGSEITFNFSGATSAGDPIFKFNNLAAEVLSFDSNNGSVKLRLPAVSVGSYYLNFARRATVPLNADASFPWV